MPRGVDAPRGFPIAWICQHKEEVVIETSDRDEPVFLAVVIVRRQRDGEEREEVLGIYASKGAARAAVNRRQGWDAAVRIGRVDRGRVVWEGEA